MPQSVMHAGLTVPVLTTQRLVLTALQDRHLEAFTRMQYDPRVATWFGGLPDPPHDPATQLAETWRVIAMFAGHWALRGYGIWAAEDATTGELVGRLGLWNPHGWVGIEVGWLIDPRRWGQGLATEGARAALDWAFDTLDTEEINSVTVPGNAASRRVMAKLGLRDTGRTVMLRGHEQVHYRMTRQEHRDARTT